MLSYCERFDLVRILALGIVAPVRRISFALVPRISSRKEARCLCPRGLAECGSSQRSAPEILTSSQDIKTWGL